jgi:serine/threonine-protein kinase RsbW
MHALLALFVTRSYCAARRARQQIPTHATAKLTIQRVLQKAASCTTGVINASDLKATMVINREQIQPCECPPTGYSRRDHDKRTITVAAMLSALTASVLALAETTRKTITATKWFELAVEATASNARQLRARFQQWLQTLGAPATLVDDLTLAVYEALANVVEHAYPPDHPNPKMRLHARIEHHQLLITISDHGRWRTPPPQPGYRGRGLTMMRSLTTELHLHPSPDGTTVQLRAPSPCSGR